MRDEFTGLAAAAEKWTAGKGIDVVLDLAGGPYTTASIEEWGGGLDPNRKVRISYLRAQRMLMYRIADPGPGFKFEGLTHAAVANPPEDPVRHLLVRDKKHIRAGGFGIMLTRASVDELIYNEAQNEVVLVKYLD